MPGRKVVVVLPHTGKERYKVHACLMASHNGGVPTVLLRTNTCGGAKPARLVLILLATRQATCVLKTTLHARSSLYTSHAPNGELSRAITSLRAKRCPFHGPKGDADKPCSHALIGLAHMPAPRVHNLFTRQTVSFPGAQDHADNLIQLLAYVPSSTAYMCCPLLCVNGATKLRGQLRSACNHPKLVLAQV